MSSYWEKRALQNAKRTDKEIDKTMKEIIGNFEEAEKEIQSMLSDFYLRYASENGLTYVEAQQLLSTSELKNFHSTLEEFKAMAEDSFGTFNKELNTMSYKVRVTRLQALEAEIKGELDILYGKNAKLTENCLKNVFNESYTHALYDIDVYTNTLHNFAKIDDRMLKEALNYPTSGLSFSERIWKQQIDLTTKLKQTFINQSILGKNPYQYAKELSKLYKTKKYEAYRLLFNESAALSENAELRAYQEDGIEEYQILATLDSKTSEICQEQDGKIYKVSEAKQGVNLPPFHVNCRTTTMPYIDVDYTGTRIARDENGKSYYVPSSTTYSEWQELHRVNESISERIKNKPIIEIDTNVDPKRFNINIFDKDANKKVNDTFREILVRSIKNDNLEISGILNLDSMEVEWFKGNAYNTSLPAGYVFKDNSLWLHNHPRGSSLSIEDIYEFKNNLYLKGIGAISNGQDKGWLVIKNDRFKPEELTNELRKYYNRVEDKNNDVQILSAIRRALRHYKGVNYYEL